MKKIYFFPQAYSLGLILIIFALTISSCKKSHEEPAVPDEQLQVDHNTNNRFKNFSQVNLVSNHSGYDAANIDPQLINGWGIAFSSTGTPWVASQGGHVSTIYNREGGTQLPPVNIPSPGGATGGNPTGIVFNPNAADFIIPSGNATAAAAARFIFVGVDGIVSGWNGTWGTNSYLKFNHVATSAYTGLTLADNGGSNYLYAADFRAGKIVVWDKNWNPVSMQFRDWHLPWGYSPFNIQNIGGLLYVTYAKVGPDGRSQHGQGKGFVNIYKTNGSFVKRFASKESLNAPWGVAMAPASFFDKKDLADSDEDGRHENDTPHAKILVGNFGDGRINVYNLRGKYLGQLKHKNKHTIEIEGLWAITFPPSTSTIDPNRLYFAAGPDHETDGLFGYIIKDSVRHHQGHHHGDD